MVRNRPLSANQVFKFGVVLVAVLVFASMAFPVGVGASDADAEAIGEFEVVDRSTDEVTAYVHGDHWHGDLPHVDEGEHISLGANIENADGEEIDLSGDEYSLGVELADGAEEGVVSFDEHGDHVHIEGEAQGHTEVVFQLVHDDHVDYETPSIEVEVEHHDQSDGDSYEVTYELVVDTEEDVTLSDELAEVTTAGVCDGLEEMTDLPSEWDCESQTDTEVGGHGAEHGTELDHYHAWLHHEFEHESDANALRFDLYDNNILHQDWVAAFEDTIDSDLDVSVQDGTPFLVDEIENHGTELEYELVVDTEQEVEIGDDLDAALESAVCDGFDRHGSIDGPEPWGEDWQDLSPPADWDCTDRTDVHITAHGAEPGDEVTHLHAHVTHEFESEAATEDTQWFTILSHKSVDDTLRENVEDALLDAYGTAVLEPGPFTLGAFEAVEDHHDHDHDDEIGEFEIVDRSTDEVAAYVHGDHWHGELPHVHEDDHISLGAIVEDGHGEGIELDGDHYSLGVRLAEGAHEGVVSFDEHGDHVHIVGEEAGHTDVVFQLVHDGHAEYETPSIGVEVEDHHDDDDDEITDDSTDADEDDQTADDTTDADDSVPGFGVGGALAGVGSLAYLLKRRLTGNARPE